MRSRESHPPYPRTSATSSSNSENFIFRAVGSAYEFTVCPSNCTSEYPSSASCRTSRKIDSLPRLRSGPRVCGTTQYAQALSHPSIIVRYARQGLSRRVISVSNVSSVSLSSPVTRRFPASSSRQHLRQLPVTRRPANQTHPRRALENPLALLLRHAPEHPNNLPARPAPDIPPAAKTPSAPPSPECCKCCTKSSAPPQESPPADTRAKASNPATFSESWSFIWHPNVSR